MHTRYWFLAAVVVGMVTTTSTFAQGRMESVRIQSIKWAPCDPKAPEDPCQMAYFRGDPEKEENYSMIRVPKGYKFGPHWHTSDEHLVVTKGTFVVGAEGGQEKDLVLKAGDYAFIPARLVHWASFPEETIFYLNVVGPDSYIDVKDKRP